MKTWNWLVALLAVVLLSGSAAWAAEDFYVIAGGGAVGTKISSVPYTITQPGFYLLTGNLTYNGAGNAITVGPNVNDVVIDLMGFRLTNAGAAGTTKGVYIDSTCKNVTVRNGTVRGFYEGILAAGGSSGCQVINVTASGNSYLGIELDGLNPSLVKDCDVSNNGGGIFRVLRHGYRL